MKWRNAKKVAPLNGELCVFYLGNYEYVVGRIIGVFLVNRYLDAINHSPRTQ